MEERRNDTLRKGPIRKRDTEGGLFGVTKDHALDSLHGLIAEKTAKSQSLAPHKHRTRTKTQKKKGVVQNKLRGDAEAGLFAASRGQTHRHDAQNEKREREEEGMGRG